MKKCFDKCGNKLKFTEDLIANLIYYNECDDGNLENGDGCSESCQVEDGYFCLKSSDVDLFKGTTTDMSSPTDQDFSKLNLNVKIDPDICYFIGNLL